VLISHINEFFEQKPDLHDASWFLGLFNCASKWWAPAAENPPPNISNMQHLHRDPHQPLATNILNICSTMPGPSTSPGHWCSPLPFVCIPSDILSVHRLQVEKLVPIYLPAQIHLSPAHPSYCRISVCKGTSVRFLTPPILSHLLSVHSYSPSSPLHSLQGPHL
jgi:hypothetical protein